MKVFFLSDIYHKFKVNIFNICKKMDLHSVSLFELLSDMAETDVLKCQVVVKVVEKLSETRFVIADTSMTAKIDFEPAAKKMLERIKEKKTYRMFALQKISSESVLFKKASYLKEEEQPLDLTEDPSFLSTLDLLGKTPKTIIEEPILMKVITIYDASSTSKNDIPFQKVVLADNHHKLFMTFWREDIIKISNLMKEGDIVCIRNFQLDNYPDPSYTKMKRPQDFVFRNRSPATIVKKMAENNVPDNHVDKIDHIKDVLIQGYIKFIDQIYEYDSCHGKNDKICGKKVRDGAKYCDKGSCKVELNRDRLIKDYKVTLVVLSQEGFKQLTAFRKSLKEFENMNHGNIQERLGCLIDAKVDIKISESNNADDDPIVVKLTKL